MSAICEFKEGLKKKSETVYKLLKTVYLDKLQCMWYNNDNGMITVQFNKHQAMRLEFAYFDTWNTIKVKMDKLSKSDGICVVCMEQEKGKKKLEKCCDDCPKKVLKVTEVSGLCAGCCEFICNECYKKMEGHKCPICRICLLTYEHKYNQVECDCDDCTCSNH